MQGTVLQHQLDLRSGLGTLHRSHPLVLSPTHWSSELLQDFIRRNQLCFSSQVPKKRVVTHKCAASLEDKDKDMQVV